MKAKDVDFPRVNAGVAEALRTFSRSSSRAIKRVYAGPRRRKGVYGSDSSSSDESPEHSSDSDSDDDEGPNEVVFLVYFSLFTIEEFARELLFLLDTVHDVSCAERRELTPDYDCTPSVGYGPDQLHRSPVEAEQHEAQLLVQAIPWV